MLLAQAAGLLLIAQEREHFVLQGSVREWTRRIAETTLMLQPLGAAERAQAVSRAGRRRRGRRARLHCRPGPPARPPARAPQRGFVQLPLLSDFEQTLKEQLRAALGPGYECRCRADRRAAAAGIPMPVPFYEAHELAAHQASAQRYDVTVRFADGDSVVYRITRMPAARRCRAICSSIWCCWC